MADLVGKTISHYRITEQVGQGGMGVVYKAQDVMLKRTVALKFLSPEHTKNKETVKRFMNEAHAASSLDHPNICTIHEIAETEDGKMFIVMTFYKGKTLKDRIEEGPLSVKEAVAIAIQIASGLAKAHSQKIVHRDIKPANIILTNDGTAKILDFGLAKMADIKLTKTGTILGTLAYMSPEQLRGYEVDERTDVWSLAVVLYEMLSGQLPFKGDIEQAIFFNIINEERKPIDTVRADVPKEIESVLDQAMEKSVDVRYQQMDEMLSELKVVAGETDTGRSRRGIGKRRLRPGERGFIQAIVALLVVLLVSSGVYFWRQGQEPTTTAVPESNGLVEQKLEAESARDHMVTMKKGADQMNAANLVREIYESAAKKEEESNNAMADQNYKNAAVLFDLASGLYKTAADEAKMVTKTRRKLLAEKEVISQSEMDAQEARNLMVDKKLAARVGLAEKYEAVDYQKGLDLEERGDIARENGNFTEARNFYIEAERHFAKAEASSLETANLVKKIERVKNNIAQIKRNFKIPKKEDTENLAEEQEKAGYFTKALDSYDIAYKLLSLRTDLLKKLAFVNIQGGRFTMGDEDGRPDEQPAHEVRVNNFEMSKFEVTNAQYVVFLNSQGLAKDRHITWLDITPPDSQIEKMDEVYRVKPGFDNYPVVYVTWGGAMAFCEWLEGRLPTEAEWEYACRSGNSGTYLFGNNEKELKEYAWYKDQNNNSPRKVGEKLPNEFGLYDMLGNVWEWCANWYDPKYYANKEKNNPRGPAAGTARALRGGAVNSDSDECRVTTRSALVPFDRHNSVGFRVLRVVK